jgi:hypothetical protein
MNAPHLTRSTRIASISALGLSVGLALSACSPSTSSAVGAASSAAPSAAATPSASAPTAAAQPATSPVTTSTPAVTTTPATATPTASPRATLMPMQTAAGGEFVSPSGNISCEVDYHHAGLTRAYCQTAESPRSVTMSVAGKYTTCAGQQCLGNSGSGTPTLAYGTATGVGPFRCESAATGVTCVAHGRGFQISASGITPVPA